MEDQSILNYSQFSDDLDVNEVVRAVCLQGFTYGKYQKAVVERYGQDMDDKICRFFEELAWSRFLKLKMTDTYTLSLKYLGSEIGLDGETMEEIIHWQSAKIESWQNSWDKRTDLIVLVIASNASMKELCPNHRSKAEEVGSLVHEFIDRYCHSSHWEDVSLAIVNYAQSAKLSMRPTPFKDIDKQDYPYTGLMEESDVYISKGLEEAMNLYQLHQKQKPNSKIYVVLVSDGADNNPAGTKAILDIIKQKRDIELYTYFIETLGQSEIEKAKFEDFRGGILLKNDFAHSLDWWIDRDLLLHPWYEHEGYYSRLFK